MGRRLIFIDDKPGYGGVSTCLICLANELCKRGYEIALIAAKKSVYESRVDASVQIEECDFTDEKAVERMIESLNDRGAGIVNSHADSGIQIRLLSQKNRTYQLYLTEHLAIFDDPEYIEPRKEYFSLANQADKVITVSLAGRRAFQAAGVEYQKLATVYNGVKAKPYRERTYKEIRLMYAGRLTETKGIFTLLKAMDLVRQQIPEAKVNIYGTGRQEQEVRDYIREHHLEEQCILKGFCDCMEKAYQEHEIVISPSRTESCSFTILEAMNESCVVLASDVDGTRELVYDGVTERLHPFGDAETLAGQIIELMKEPEKLRMLAQNGHYEVTHSFRQEDSVKKYIQCLTE